MLTQVPKPTEFYEIEPEKPTTRFQRLATGINVKSVATRFLSLLSPHIFFIFCSAQWHLTENVWENQIL